MTLKELFHSPLDRFPGYWIHLPKNDSEWTLATDVYFPPHDPVSDEPVLADHYVRRGYVSTLNIDDVEDIVRIADNLAAGPNDSVRLEAFRLANHRIVGGAPSDLASFVEFSTSRVSLHGHAHSKTNALWQSNTAGGMHMSAFSSQQCAVSVFPARGSGFEP